MQFFSTIALLASVAVTIAAPFPNSGLSDITNTGEACPVGKQQACCNTGNTLDSLLGGVCELNILGRNCAGNIQCCQVDSSGSLLSGSCAPAISA